MIPNGLNYPYQKLSQSTAWARLQGIKGLSQPFTLHVGSNLPRKNRDGVIRIFARTKDKWNGRLVFAGDALDAELLSLTTELGVSDRVVQIKDPSSELLEI